jgi:hypothetical protein
MSKLFYVAKFCFVATLFMKKNHLKATIILIPCKKETLENIHLPIPNPGFSTPYPIKELEGACLEKIGLELYGILCKNIDIIPILIVFSVVITAIILTIFHKKRKRPQDLLAEQEWPWIKPNGGSDMPGRYRGGSLIMTVPPLFGGTTQAPPLIQVPPRPTVVTVEPPVQEQPVKPDIPFGDPGLPAKKL